MAQVDSELGRLRKQGVEPHPVQIRGKTIATTFWGKAWCQSLESHSDFANRLPRGRTYVRSGSVVDLRVTGGTIHALVSGSSLYEVQITIAPISPTRWATLVASCVGRIGSLMSLLRGELSAPIIEAMVQRESGLFPKPSEIELRCSCPDWASMCKHVAATLYGVGHNLDTNPALLFSLRGVDAADLIAQAAPEALSRSTASTIDESSLTEIFGIELTRSKTRPEISATGSTPTTGHTGAVIDEAVASWKDTDDGMGAPRARRAPRKSTPQRRTQEKQPIPHPVAASANTVTAAELDALGVSKKNVEIWVRRGVIVRRPDNRFTLTQAGVVIVSTWRDRPETQH